MNEFKAKHSDPLEKARACLKESRYTVTYHANVRKKERVIALPDVIHAIESVYWEKKKDNYDNIHRAWNYSFRGKTHNNRKLRVIVSFDENELLIITVIVLEEKSA